MIDLVCLVADRNMEAVVTTLLAEHHALGIRPIQTNVFPHPQHDPGCFASAVPSIHWALSRVGKQKSSSIYRAIVENLGLGKCSDHSFLRFKSTLQTWFPVT